ncbi:MAG: TonB-dependent receptor [Burkholderiaceae bacterium]
MSLEHNAFRLSPIASAILHATVLALVLPASAHAGEGDGDTGASPSVTLDNVTVTAQKRKENIQKVPSAVTAVQGEAIQIDELRTTKDIAKEVPGATAWNAEYRARPRFFIRGIGSNEATNNAVQPIGIYFDEVYYLNSLFLGGPLFDLERVEVLRGPQGTLWGKNTTGGAYNFISAAPSFTEGGYAKVGVGDYGQRLVEGAFTGPIVDGVLAQRLSLHYDERDGWATNRLNGQNIGGLKDLAVRYQLLANLGENATATLNLHARHFSGSSTPSYPVTLAGTTTLDGYVSPYVSTGDRSKVDYSGDSVDTTVNTEGVSLKVDWNIGDLLLTSISAYDEGEREVPAADTSITPQTYSWTYSKNRARQYSEELRLASPREDRFNWIVGAYYFDDLNHNYAATAAVYPVSTTTRALTYSWYRQTTQSAAAFASATFDVTERFSLTAGLRYTVEKVGIDLDTLASTTTADGTVPFTSSNWWRVANSPLALEEVQTQNESRTWNNLGFDFTPSFQIDDNQLAYARVASGYRSGNYAGGSSATSPPTVVNPEKLTAYEVGYKSEWLGGRLSVNGAAYYYDYSDIQLTVNRIIDGTFYSILANAGQGYVKGAEIEVKARLTPNLSLHGNYSDLRTRYTKLVTGGVSYAGYNFARVPNTTGLIGLDYDLPLGSGALKLGADWAWTGKHNFNVTDRTDPYVVQEGYWLGTVRAGYAFNGGRTDVDVYVNNVADKVYKIQAQLYAYNYYTTRLGDPRTFGVTFTTRF